MSGIEGIEVFNLVELVIEGERLVDRVVERHNLDEGVGGEIIGYIDYVNLSEGGSAVHQIRNANEIIIDSKGGVANCEYLLHECNSRWDGECIYRSNGCENLWVVSIVLYKINVGGGGCDIAG